MKVLHRIAAWLVAALALALRMTCQVRIHNDPRPALRASGRPYVFATLHAHQLAFAMRPERSTGIMVSRSQDGDLVQTVIWVLGLKAFRGSSGRGNADKGGRDALNELANHVRNGHPAFLTVDGPRGPRNRARKGIAALAQQTGSAVIVAVSIPRRRWILRKTWDRMQIPKPFCKINTYVAEPLYPQQNERVEEFRQRIEVMLNQLERMRDPEEAPVRNQESLFNK
jgi:hypothetical protein